MISKPHTLSISLNDLNENLLIIENQSFSLLVPIGFEWKLNRDWWFWNFEFSMIASYFHSNLNAQVPT